MQIRQRTAGILLLLFGISNVTFGWGPDGHRFINRNAALHMPTRCRLSSAKQRTVWNISDGA
jgi:hypothetical protein